MEDNWDSVLESIKFNAEKAKYNCRLCKYTVEYCRGKKNNKCPCEFHDGKTASKEIVRLFLKIVELDK